MDKLDKYIISSLASGGDYPFVQIKREFFYSEYSYADGLQLCLQVAQLLRAKGVEKGDRIIVWGPNMPEWALLFLTSVLEGVVMVPASILSSPEVVAKYISEVDPKLVIKSIFMPDLELDPESDKASAIKVLELEHLFDYAKEFKIVTNFAGFFPEKSDDDLLEILYTSGTTGDPKGVMLTRKNFWAEISQLHELISIKRGSSIMSLLPYSHIYEQVVGLMFAIKPNGKISFLHRLSSATVKHGLVQYRPTHLVLVPEVLKSFLDKIEFKFAKVGAVGIFRGYVRLAQHLPKPVRRLLAYPILKEFGGKLKMVTVGGAKTKTSVLRSFAAFGVDVVEGYGLTETTGPVTINTPGEVKFGTSGKPFPDVELKISDDSEVLIKGEMVTPGYYQRPEKNKEVFTEEGYFLTGDMASLDEDGYLVMQGREKFRIVLSNGEKVYPEDIEFIVNELPEVDEVCVFSLDSGNGVEVAAAFVLADKAALEELADDGTKAKQVLTPIVAKANEKLELTQKITKYCVWPEDKLPKTPTYKLKRPDVSGLASEIIKDQEQQGMVGADDSAQNNKKYKGEPKPSDLKKILGLVCKMQPENMDDDTLLADLNLDSLKRLTVLTLIEDELGVAVPEEKVVDTMTIAELDELAQSLPQSKGNGKQKLGWQHARPVRYLRNMSNALLVPRFINWFISLHTLGRENLLPKAIYAGNHPGPYDYLCLYREFGWKNYNYITLASDEHWVGPRRFLDGLLLKLLSGAIEIDKTGKKNQKSMAMIGEAAAGDISIVLAPSGYYTSGKDDIYDVMNGIAYLAKATDLPVIPFYITENYTEVFPYENEPNLHRLVPDFKKRGQNVVLSIGEPINIPSYLDDAETNKIISDAIWVEAERANAKLQEINQK